MIEGFTRNAIIYSLISHEREVAHEEPWRNLREEKVP